VAALARAGGDVVAFRPLGAGRPRGLTSPVAGPAPGGTRRRSRAEDGGGAAQETGAAHHELPRDRMPSRRPCTRYCCTWYGQPSSVFHCEHSRCRTSTVATGRTYRTEERRG